ncbi:MAG: LamG-like jellyroll fold domain-containing protein [Rhodothermales bacterium]
MPAPRLIARCASLLLLGIAASCAPEPPARLHPVFYASFDAGLSADIAAGDSVLYVAPTPDALDAREPLSTGNPLARRVPGGRAGHALRVASDWNPVVLYRAAGNVPYAASDWSGTFSLWLKVDPETGLAPGYSDPFVVTDKNWDDAALYVDLTQDDVPRHFRFAAFADKAVWNPEQIPWDDIAPAMRPMIDVADPPFSGDAWTHIALVFEQLNTGGGQITGYLNGRPVGSLEGRDLRLTWDLDRAVMLLGRHYTGLIDEVAVFDRALEAGDIQTLYEQPASDLFRP